MVDQTGPLCCRHVFAAVNHGAHVEYQEVVVDVFGDGSLVLSGASYCAISVHRSVSPTRSGRLLWWIDCVLRRHTRRRCSTGRSRFQRSKLGRGLRVLAGAPRADPSGASLPHLICQTCIAKYEVPLDRELSGDVWEDDSAFPWVAPICGDCLNEYQLPA